MGREWDFDSEIFWGVFVVWFVAVSLGGIVILTINYQYHWINFLTTTELGTYSQLELPMEIEMKYKILAFQLSFVPSLVESVVIFVPILVVVELYVNSV